MTIEIQNETHWRDDDIVRLVEEATEVAGLSDRNFEITVDYDQGCSWDVIYAQNQLIGLTITIYLPKVGPSEGHPIPLVALAAAVVESDTPSLACQMTYELANLLAATVGGMFGGTPVTPALYASKWSNMPPSWCSDLIIRENDPMQDFIKKREKEIASAERAIEKWSKTRDSAQRRIDTAQAKLAKARSSLDAVMKRRE